jgi:ferric-dicitrate binding protein FerR (iron transport regulator)
MFTADLMRGPRAFAAILVAAGLIAATLVGSPVARAGGACALVANEHDPSVKILRCGDNLTVHAAPGARYRPIAKAGQPLPAAIRLDEGALLIEFQPSPQQQDFQILTPLAVAAVRGTKWAVEVGAARTSTLVLAGAVAVTNRRLNQYVILREGEGVDITPSDMSMVQKRWGEARVRALLARFGE